jgi:radical SAM family uncharacterized protein/radical SAM-linked protein
MKNNLLENHLTSVRRPSRYLGRELFSIIKDPQTVGLRFALAFPDLYEVGMSYLGMKILYHILNRRPEVWAERVFTPAPDMARMMKEQAILLPSLESGTPLKDFDVVGFSLSYELGYTNVLNMLSQGGISLWAEERQEEDPLVIAGGPCTFNPEPMAGFFDALVIGDGEAVIEEICDIWLAWKKGRGNRLTLLASLAALPGVYVPGVQSPDRQEKGNRPAIQKRIIPDISRAGYPAISPMPYQQIIHDRLSVEIARGCTRGCRFCQAGILYRPVRERAPEQVYLLLEEGLSRTGYTEATLLSLSSGDYTCLNVLLPALMERWEGERVGISLPSLRVDTLGPELIEQILRVRKTGFTIAPEAGTQRLRDVINKNITEEEIIETAQRVFSLGWRVLKLYFMIGLPTEAKEDLEGLVDLVRKIARVVRKKGQGFEIHVALSTFIPKPHTPFQWAPQLSMEESLSRLAFIRSALQSRHIQVKWNEPRQSFLEGVLSRGDRKTGRVIFRAFQKGSVLDGWGEHFSWDLWKQAFDEEGIDPQDCLEPRNREEDLPWDFVQTGVGKGFLWAEYQRGLAEESTPDCRQGECHQCGVCPAFAVKPLFHSEFTVPSGRRLTLYPTESLKKFRLLVTKMGPSRFFGHLEWKEALIRSLRRAGLPLFFSQGFHPMPRLSFGQALPVGLSSLGEFIDVYLLNWMTAGAVKNRLPEELFPGTKILEISEVPLNSPLPRGQNYHYRVDLAQALVNEDHLKTFWNSSQWPVERPGKKPGILDLKTLIEELSLLPKDLETATVHWVLKPGMEGEIRPETILRSLFHLEESTLHGLTITRSLSPFIKDQNP